MHFGLHGKKAGWIALVFSAFPFILVHLIFYPQIMNLVVFLASGFIKRMLEYCCCAGGGKQTWAPITRFFGPNHVLFYGISLSLYYALWGFSWNYNNAAGKELVER